MHLSTPQPARHFNPTTKASALAYAIFDRPDLKKAEEYLIDFGLRPVSNDGETLLMRGTGPDPYCYIARKAASASASRSRRLPISKPCRSCPARRRSNRWPCPAAASACG